MVSGSELRKTVFRLAIPVVFMNLFQTLAMTIDIMMVGRLGKEAIGGVTLGGHLMFMVMTVFMAISAGTIALVARFTGSGELDKRGDVLSQSLSMAVMLSMPILLLGAFFPGGIIGIYGAEGLVFDFGKTYVGIVFIGAPLFAIMTVSSSAFIATGDTRTPLYVNGTMNIVNVFMNYVLIFGKFGFPRMGVTGAALGTLISFAWGAALYSIMVMHRDGTFRIRISALAPRKNMIKRIMRIGIPSAGEQFIIQTGFIAYMAILVSFGATALAATSIGMRIQSMAFMPGMGFAMAAGSLTGRYLGKKDPDMAGRSGWTSLQLSILTMGSVGIIMFFLAPQIAWLFIDDQEVIDLAVVFIRILAIGIPAIATHFTLAGALRGAGDTKYPLLATAIGIYGVRIPLAITLGFFTPLGVLGVWLSMITEYYARSIVITLRYYKGHWKSTEV